MKEAKCDPGDPSVNVTSETCHFDRSLLTSLTKHSHTHTTQALKSLFLCKQTKKRTREKKKDFDSMNHMEYS